jgi:hypothetical protein
MIELAPFQKAIPPNGLSIDPKLARSAARISLCRVNCKSLLAGLQRTQSSRSSEDIRHAPLVLLRVVLRSCFLVPKAAAIEAVHFDRYWLVLTER